MAQQVIGVGTVANDRTGDTWRDAFVKVNANETELYADVATLDADVIRIDADVAAVEADIVTIDADITALEVPGPTGIVSVAGNTGLSTITTVNTPVLAAATFVVGSVSLFTGTTAGRLTYTAAANAVITVNAVVDIEPDSGTGKDLTTYIAINGTVAASSGRIVTTDTAAPLNVPLIWQVTLSTNDYIEIYVENNTDTIDVLVSGAVLVVS